jgi:hypothetical protein
VLLHRPLGDLEALGDALVRAPFRHELEHLALAVGERAQRPVLRVARQQPRDDLRVERRAAGDDAPQRAGELVDVADAVLEQVAEPLGVLGEQARRVPTSTCWERSRSDPGMPRADLAAAAQPSSVNVGGMRMSTIATSAGARRPPAALAGAEPRGTSIPRAQSEAMPSRTGLSSAITTRTAAPRDHGPAPGGLVTKQPAVQRLDAVGKPRSPSRAPASAPPTPSSAISMRRRPRARERTSRGGPAYLPTFVSASQAHEVGGELDGSGTCPARRSDRRRHGRPDASDSSAGLQPWSSAAGCMPRASSRSSSSDCASSPLAR